VEPRPAPVLEFLGISKDYFGNRVLHDVDLSLFPGEIHALVGENGAGKSTLMNILFGMPVIRETGGFRGGIRIDGAEVRFPGPDEAMAAGIGMVHQEFMLLPGLTVEENVKLHREPVRETLAGRLTGGKLDFIDRKRLGEEARKSLASVGLTLDEWIPVAGLPVGHMQFVEIAREVDKRGLSVLIFDEPTAVLTEDEAARLLELMRDLATEKRIGILFITHRLDEVIEVADRVTVIRDGRVIETLDAADATPAHLAERMVGRPVEHPSSGDRRGDTNTPVMLSLEDLHVAMPGEEVHGVSIEVKRGEILGIGGLAGHGKVGIANGIMGLYPARGRVRIDGEDLTLGNPARALDRGLAFVSEDRRGVGLLLDTSIEDNVVATAVLSQRRFLAGPKLFGPFRPVRRGEVRSRTLELIEELDLRCTGPDQPVRRLSGGNQQKVCIARAMVLSPRILLVSEPTRGIDIGAKQRILGLLSDLRDEGMTIVMTSSELAELRSLCDRIAIIYRGRIEAELEPDEDDVKFGLAMAGELDLREERS